MSSAGGGKNNDISHQNHRFLAGAALRGIATLVCLCLSGDVHTRKHSFLHLGLVGVAELVKTDSLSTLPIFVPALGLLYPFFVGGLSSCANARLAGIGAYDDTILHPWVVQLAPEATIASAEFLA